jgi:hypothetical protein
VHFRRGAQIALGTIGKCIPHFQGKALLLGAREMTDDTLVTPVMTARMPGTPVPAPQDFIDGLRDSGMQDQSVIDTLSQAPLTSDQWADLCDCLFSDDDADAVNEALIEADADA